MPDLVPSTKRVEHLRIDRLAVGDVQILVEDVPDVVGIGLVIVRLVARALAGRDHLEAAGARPVDVLADQRRLVAPGQAVDDAGRLGLAREQRARQRVGLDVDHHDVLAMRDRLERVANAGLRDAGRLDDHLDARMAISASASAVTWVPRVLQRIVERRRGILLVGPAGGGELAPRALDVEVGDADDDACRA